MKIKCYFPVLLYRNSHDELGQHLYFARLAFGLFLLLYTTIVADVTEIDLLAKTHLFFYIN